MKDREDLIHDRIQQIGLDAFPDNPEVTWRAWAIRNEGDYSAVDADASPADVGYEKFRFVLRFSKDKPPVVAGCYAYEKGRWSLLFTDPKEPAEWRKLFDERM